MVGGVLRSRGRVCLIAALLLAGVVPASADTGSGGPEAGRVRAAAKAAGLASLATVPVPVPSNLGRFLNAGAGARKAARQLGKALFWDMQVGSDGQACASCHFQAGADNRAKNQVDPGLVGGDTTFGNSALAGVPGNPRLGPNSTLTWADFPFHRVADENQRDYSGRKVERDTNDVVSSQGVLSARFTGDQPGRSSDGGTPVADGVFNVGGVNTRRVEPRNTPTAVNAVFNFANFWDGRAHNRFNGVNPFGPLDDGARVVVSDTGGNLVPTAVSIDNASLASQAVGPPGNPTEMSFLDRSFPQIGRKLLGLRPLGMQLVHPEDSLLGPLSAARLAGSKVTGSPGLTRSYADLVRAAFRPELWRSGRQVGGFSQMEANFSLFFGLAVQMYESKLVSDRTPFDRFMAGDDTALTPDQLKGLLVFLKRPAASDPVFSGVGQGNCVSCHGGPELTNAGVTTVRAKGAIGVDRTAALADGELRAGQDTAFQDEGFFDIGVRPTREDPGRGGTGPGGRPLSFSRQALSGSASAPPLPSCGGPSEQPCPRGGRVAVDGAFKTPGLRNVALTGPYFHNGGQATLGQVVDFYRRQGDFGDVNVANVDKDLAAIDLGGGDEDRLIRFLLGLTDARVRQEKAPFDHPQLLVPNGHPGGSGSLTCTNGMQACDQRLEIPVTGGKGRPAAGLPPLRPFLGLDPFFRG